MPEIPEASKAVLTPKEVSKLQQYGLTIAYEEITAITDEKKELLNKAFKKGDDVKIEYIINGAKTEVGYHISNLEPSYAYIGEGTLVIIEGEDREEKTRHNELVRLLNLDSINKKPDEEDDFIESCTIKKKGKHISETRGLLRGELQKRFVSLEEDIALCQKEGLNADKIVIEANLIKTYLRNLPIN